MLAINELPENPVTLTVADRSGERHTIITERLKGGRIRMRCTCTMHARGGWCRHLVDLLCMRYDRLEERCHDLELSFEDIVLGTSLEDVANEVDLALADYEKALRNFEARRADGLDVEALDIVGGLARDVSEAANHLASAVGRFRKKLSAANGG